MALAGVVLELTIIVVTMIVTTAIVTVGPDRFVAAVSDFRRRGATIAAPIGVLVAVLLIRFATKDVMPRLSWQIIGLRITHLIFSVESVLFDPNPVVLVQSFRSPELTSFFVFVYMYGYVFLISFPFVAYFVLDEMDHMSTLIVAFATNYAIGVVCYVLFIAYGPRNYDPLLFENVLFTSYPQAGLLTGEINQNTNVFPSLHTSLSMTTFFLAWQTRDEYPLWVPIAGIMALSVVMSTMYLGIHWFTDAVAGTVLALVSVHVGRTYSANEAVRLLRRRLSDHVERVRGYLDRHVEHVDGTDRE